MPFVNGVYQPDPRSPIERLYGFRQKQAELQKMQQDQEMQKQRLEILRGAYTPEQPGTSAMVEMPEAEMMRSPAAERLFNLGAIQPEQAKPKVIRPATEATPARFDADGAIQRLYSIGDLEGAEKVADLQRRQKQDLNRWSGAVTYIEDPENPGVTIAVQPSTQGEGDPYRRIGVAAMTPEARLRAQQKDEDQALDREKLGMQRQEFLFQQRKFYEGPEVKAREDALQSLQKQRDSAESTFAVLNQVEPYLDKASGSDLMKLARKGGAFVGLDSAAATADRMIDMAAASLTLTAPKLGGAASDRDVALYEQARGNLRSGTTEQKREAIKFIRESLQRFGAAEQRQPMSTPNQSAPKPKTLNSMPNPAQYAGKKVRDTTTGIVYQSNGKQWVRVK